MEFEFGGARTARCRRTVNRGARSRGFDPTPLRGSDANIRLPVRRHDHDDGLRRGRNEGEQLLGIPQVRRRLGGLLLALQGPLPGNPDHGLDGHADPVVSRQGNLEDVRVGLALLAIARRGLGADGVPDVGDPLAPSPSKGSVTRCSGSAPPGRKRAPLLAIGRECIPSLRPFVSGSRSTSSIDLSSLGSFRSPRHTPRTSGPWPTRVSARETTPPISLDGYFTLYQISNATEDSRCLQILCRAGGSSCRISRKPKTRALGSVPRS
jgi:hypothetical protein